MDNSNARHQDPSHFMRQNDPNRTSSLTDGDSDGGPQRPTSASHYNNKPSSQDPTSVQLSSPPSSSSSSREQGNNRPCRESSTPGYVEQEQQEEDGGNYSSSPAYERNKPNINPELTEERLSYAQTSTQHGNNHYHQQKNQHHQHQQYKAAVGSLIRRDSYEIDNNNNSNNYYDYATNTYDWTTRSPGGGGGARRGTDRAEHVISTGGPGNFLSQEMGNLSMNVEEPTDPMNNYQDNNNEQYFNPAAPSLQQNLYEDQYQYSQHEEQYPPYQSQQQHQLISAGRIPRPANLPQPRAGTPPIADDETFRSRILDNLDLPPQRLGRRCLTFKRSKRLPDRVMGVIVEGTGTNTSSSESDVAWIKIECIGCQSSLQVPKESVIVECPVCHGFHPVASCHVRSTGR